MHCRIVDLRCKEVINICDGKRLGFPFDVEVDADTGHIVAIIVLGPPKYWGIFGKGCEHVVPWCDVRRIGEDLIIVEYEKRDHPHDGLKRELKKELFRELVG